MGWLLCGSDASTYHKSEPKHRVGERAPCIRLQIAALSRRRAPTVEAFCRSQTKPRKPRSLTPSKSCGQSSGQLRGVTSS